MHITSIQKTPNTYYHCMMPKMRSEPRNFKLIVLDKSEVKIILLFLVLWLYLESILRIWDRQIISVVSCFFYFFPYLCLSLCCLIFWIFDLNNTIDLESVKPIFYTFSLLKHWANLRLNRTRILYFAGHIHMIII